MREMLITDLQLISRLAEQKRERFEIMRYMLEFDESVDDTELDAAVESIARSVVEAIDCTQCANCCRHLHVYLTPEDMEGLTSATNLSKQAVLETYVNQSEDVRMLGEWGRFRARPCAFLKGTLCAIYLHRPDTCRRYPQFTPDFRWVLQDLIDGASICPIIYNVLSHVELEVNAGRL